MVLVKLTRATARKVLLCSFFLGIFLVLDEQQCGQYQHGTITLATLWKSCAVLMDIATWMLEPMLKYKNLVQGKWLIQTGQHHSDEPIQVMRINLETVLSIMGLTFLLELGIGLNLVFLAHAAWTAMSTMLILGGTCCMWKRARLVMIAGCIPMCLGYEWLYQMWTDTVERTEQMQFTMWEQLLESVQDVMNFMSVRTEFWYDVLSNLMIVSEPIVEPGFFEQLYNWMMHLMYQVWIGQFLIYIWFLIEVDWHKRSNYFQIIGTAVSYGFVDYVYGITWLDTGMMLFTVVFLRTNYIKWQMIVPALCACMIYDPVKLTTLPCLILINYVTMNGTKKNWTRYYCRIEVTHIGFFYFFSMIYNLCQQRDVERIWAMFCLSLFGFNYYFQPCMYSYVSAIYHNFNFFKMTFWLTLSGYEYSEMVLMQQNPNKLNVRHDEVFSEWIVVNLTEKPCSNVRVSRFNHYYTNTGLSVNINLFNNTNQFKYGDRQHRQNQFGIADVIFQARQQCGKMLYCFLQLSCNWLVCWMHVPNHLTAITCGLITSAMWLCPIKIQEKINVILDDKEKESYEQIRQSQAIDEIWDQFCQRPTISERSHITESNETGHDNNAWQQDDYHARLRRNVLLQERRESLGMQQPKYTIRHGAHRSAVLCDLVTRRSIPSCRGGPPSYHAASLHSHVRPMETPIQKMRQRFANFVQQMDQNSGFGSNGVQQVFSNEQNMSDPNTTFLTHDFGSVDETADQVQLPTEIESKQALFERMTPLYHTNNEMWKMMKESIQQGMFIGLINIGKSVNWLVDIIVRLLLIPVLVANVFMVPTFVCLLIYLCVQGGDASALSQWVMGVRSGLIDMNVMPGDEVTTDPNYGLVMKLLMTTKWCDFNCYVRWIFVNWVNIVGLAMLISAVWAWLMFFRRLLSDSSIQFFLIALMACVLVLNAHALTLVTIVVVLWNALQYYIGRHSFIDVITIIALHAPFAVIFNILSYGFTIFGYKPLVFSNVTVTDVAASSFMAGFCMGIIWLMEFRKSEIGRGHVIITRDENGRLIDRHVQFGRLSSFLFGNVAGDLMVPATALNGDFSGLWSNNKLIVTRFTAPGDENPSGEFLHAMIVNAHKQGTLSELLNIINEEKEIPMHYQTPLKVLFNADAMGIVCTKRGSALFPGEGNQQLANGWLCDIDGTTYCVTNAHAVTDPTCINDIFVKMDNQKMKPIPNLYFWTRNGLYQLELVTWDAKSDVAILTIKDCEAHGFKVGKLVVGKPYIWCGCAPPLTNPGSVFFYNVLCSTRGQVYHPNGEYGDSGSILIDNRGNVVAMKYGIQVGNTALSEIGFFVPVHALGSLKREILKSQHELIKEKKIAPSTILSQEILSNKDHREFLTNYLANTEETREKIRGYLNENNLDALNTLIADLSTDAKHLKSLQKMLTGDLVVRKGRRVIAETQCGADEQIVALKQKIERVTKDIENLQQLVTINVEDDPTDLALVWQIKQLQEELTLKKKELALRHPQTKEKETCQKLGMLGQYKSQLKQELQHLLAEKMPNQDEIKDVKEQLQLCNNTIAKVQEMLKEGKDNIDQLIEMSINPSRMPDTLRQIRYPLWYQDPDTKKYVTILSDDLKIESTAHPAFAKEVMDHHETYGYTAGQWRRRVQRAGVSYQWYQQMISQMKKLESCGFATSVKYWVKRFVLGDHDCLRQITCPDCGKKFVCDKKEHQGCSDYLVKQLERHLQCCLGHCGVGKEFMVLNTIFLFDGQHVMLSNKQHCFSSINNPEHRCFRIGVEDEDKFKSKKHHYYQVTMDDGKKIYVFKQCIDDLKKSLDAYVKPATEQKEKVSREDHENDMQRLIELYENMAENNNKMFQTLQMRCTDTEKQLKILKDRTNENVMSCGCKDTIDDIKKNLSKVITICTENSSIMSQFNNMTREDYNKQSKETDSRIDQLKQISDNNTKQIQKDVQGCVLQVNSLVTGFKALKEDVDSTVTALETTLNQAVTRNDVQQVMSEWWQKQKSKEQRHRVGFASCPTSRSNSMEDLSVRSILKPEAPSFEMPKVVTEPIFDWTIPGAVSDWAVEVEKEEQQLALNKDDVKSEQFVKEEKTENVTTRAESVTSDDEKKQEKKKRSRKKKNAKPTVAPSSSGDEVEKVQLFLSNRPGFHDNAVGDCHCPRCQCEPDCTCALCEGRYCIWCNTDQHSTVHCIHAKEKKCTKCNKYLANWWNDTFYKYGDTPCSKLCCMEAKDKPCGVCWNKGHLPLSCPILKHVAISTNPLQREINTAGVNKKVIQSLVLPMGSIKPVSNERVTYIGKNHNKKKSPVKRDFQ